MFWGFFFCFISLRFAASGQFDSNKARSKVTGSANEVWGTLPGQPAGGPSPMSSVTFPLSPLPPMYSQITCSTLTWKLCSGGGAHH